MYFLETGFDGINALSAFGSLIVSIFTFFLYFRSQIQKKKIEELTAIVKELANHTEYMKKNEQRAEYRHNLELYPLFTIKGAETKEKFVVIELRNIGQDLHNILYQDLGINKGIESFHTDQTQVNRGDIFILKVFFKADYKSFDDFAFAITYSDSIGQLHSQIITKEFGTTFKISERMFLHDDKVDLAAAFSV